MPIYEYECSLCGHRLETIQKISEKPLKKCPECGGNGLTKLVSAAAFRLKGGGWYETDFKSGNKKNVASDTNNAGGGSSSGLPTAVPAVGMHPAAAAVSQRRHRVMRRAQRAAASHPAAVTVKPAPADHLHKRGPALAVRGLGHGWGARIRLTDIPLAHQPATLRQF